METMNKDLAQVAVVSTVADKDNIIAEVGGSIVRFPIGDILKGVAGDSAEAAAALVKLNGMLEEHPEVKDAILAQISENSAAVEEMQDKQTQFGLAGYSYVEDGNVLASDGDCVSELLPVNKHYPIIAHVSGTKGNASGISLYDCNKKHIGSVNCRINTINDGIEIAIDGNYVTYTLSPEHIPNSAVYFRCGTTIADGVYYSNGPTAEARESAIADVVEAAKRLLFIDEWLAFDYTDYQPKKEKPFIANGVEMTYEEALYVKRFASPAAVTQSMSSGKIKTNLFSDSNGGGYQPIDMYAKFAFSTNLEVARLQKEGSNFYAHNFSSAFSGCVRLRKILGAINPLSSKLSFGSAFYQCSALEEVRIYHLNADVSFADSPLLSLDSLSYMVTNADNTNTIAITVHEALFAKMKGLKVFAFGAIWDEAQWKKSTTAGNEEGYAGLVGKGCAVGDYVLVYGYPTEKEIHYYFIGKVTYIHPNNNRPSVKTLFGIQETFDPASYDAEQWKQLMADAGEKNISFVTN